MTAEYFISDNHIINFAKITGAEVRRTYNYSEIESVDVHFSGAYVKLAGGTAIRFWLLYKEFAKEKNDDKSKI